MSTARLFDYALVVTTVFPGSTLEQISLTFAARTPFGDVPAAVAVTLVRGPNRLFLFGSSFDDACTKGVEFFRIHHEYHECWVQERRIVNQFISAPVVLVGTGPG